MKIIKVTNDRRTLLGGAAALAIVAAVGGVLIGRSTVPDGAATVEVQQAEAEEEGHEREGFVAMTPARLEASGIRTERIQAGSLGSEIIAQATVTAPPEGQALVTARADGAVVRINKRLGDAVGPGEVIALLESRDAVAFVAERNAAAARAQAARAAAARERRLFNQRITARQDLEAADAARAQAEAELQRAEAAVRAAGVTGNGRHLAVRSPIGIEAAVPAGEAQRIRPGDPAEIELPGGGSVAATVRSATPALNPESRTATVVLQTSGVPAGLVQGQAVRVRIVPRGSVSTGAIVLPEEAVQQVEGRDIVFVQVNGGFQATPVTVGRRAAGRAEITEGLRPGMTVVTAGAFALKSELGASEAEH